MTQRIERTKAGTLRKIDRQVNKIIAITKYKFGWSRKAIYKFCIQYIEPDKYEKVHFECGKAYSTSKLFQHLSQEQKSSIIKRLEKIERKIKGEKNVSNENGSNPAERREP